MFKYLKKLVADFRKQKKSSVAVYLILRVLVILSAVLAFLRGDFTSFALCILSLVLFLLPLVISDKLKIELPSLLETIIFLFIFAAEILGEVNNFYGRIPFWDTALHTLNGFLAAGIGFSLVDLLNTKIKSFNLSPFFVSIVAFCFSMTIGVLWEFLEFGFDQTFRVDMQKDRIIQQISTVELDPEKDNNAIRVDNIVSTDINLENGEIVKIEGGYLDIGIIDTMKDLIVNFIGAATFSLLGFFYIKYRGKFKFTENFIPRRIGPRI